MSSINDVFDGEARRRRPSVTVDLEAVQERARSADTARADVARCLRLGLVPTRVSLEAIEASAADMPELVGTLRHLVAYLSDMRDLNAQQLELLRRTAVALRGPEPELVSWPHGDIPDLIDQMNAERAEENRAIGEWQADARRAFDAVEKYALRMVGSGSSINDDMVGRELLELLGERFTGGTDD